MNHNVAGETSRSLGTRVVEQLFVFAICIGIPVGVTAIAPVSWVKFQRRDGRVAAQARTCMLFLIPFRTHAIDDVTEIDDRTVVGQSRRKRTSSGTKYSKPDDQGYMILRGLGGTVEVPVSPVDLDAKVEQSQTFLDDPTATELSMFVVANWKFSVIFGGLASCLTVLYVGGIAFGGTLKIIHLLQRAAGVPPQDRLLVERLARLDSWRRERA